MKIAISISQRDMSNMAEEVMDEDGTLKVQVVVTPVILSLIIGPYMIFAGRIVEDAFTSRSLVIRMQVG